MKASSETTKQILILGGKSLRHRQWIRELGDFLTQSGHTVTLHDYHHWETGETAVDIEGELRRLSDSVANLNNYVVIAKSVGTVIATLATAQNILQPKYSLFLGVPLDGVAGQTADFPTSLTTLPRMTIIQNQFDPYGSFQTVDTFFKKQATPHYEIMSVADNHTHDYLDFSLYESLVRTTR